MQKVAGIADPVDRAKAAIDLLARYQTHINELGPRTA